MTRRICLAATEGVPPLTYRLVCSKDAGHDGSHRDFIDQMEWRDGMHPVFVAWDLQRRELKK